MKTYKVTLKGTLKDGTEVTVITWEKDPFRTAFTEYPQLAELDAKPPCQTSLIATTNGRSR